MTSQGINILILCTGNSARSIIAEALLNHLANGVDVDITAYSAGSRPRGEVHPAAIAVLKAHGLPVAALRSKSWDEFALSSAPLMNVVITVCDAAADETCPLWPGNPSRVHWAMPDPATVTGSPDRIFEAFQQTYSRLEVSMHGLIDAAMAPGTREMFIARLHDIDLVAA